MKQLLLYHNYCLHCLIVYMYYIFCAKLYEKEMKQDRKLNDSIKL